MPIEECASIFSQADARENDGVARKEAAECSCAAEGLPPVMIDFAAIQQSVQVTNKHVTTEQNTQQREGRIRLFDAVKAS